MAVQMRLTRGWTKRPRGALLQLGTESEFILCRIGGRLGSPGPSRDGAAVEIPPWVNLASNPGSSRGTVPGG
jgi:hypothetical protein